MSQVNSLNKIKIIKKFAPWFDPDGWYKKVQNLLEPDSFFQNFLRTQIS